MLKNMKRFLTERVTCPVWAVLFVVIVLLLDIGYFVFRLTE